jgi:3-deoxy-D-manno-octulosonic-acid transferase
VALVDTIGELEHVYALSDVVFVGGSLVPHGGQNMLEPAAQGRPVVFGPHVHNFVQEVALLEKAGACVKLAGRGRARARAGAPAGRRRRARAPGARRDRGRRGPEGGHGTDPAALEERCLGAAPT